MSWAWADLRSLASSTRFFVTGRICLLSWLSWARMRTRFFGFSLSTLVLKLPTTSSWVSGSKPGPEGPVCVVVDIWPVWISSTQCLTRAGDVGLDLLVRVAQLLEPFVFPVLDLPLDLLLLGSDPGGEVITQLIHPLGVYGGLENLGGVSRATWFEHMVEHPGVLADEQVPR